MNNLKLSWELSSNLRFQLEDEFLRFATFDIERSRLFFASSANFIYTAQFHSSQNEVGQTFLPATVELIDLEPGDFITSMDYLLEKEDLIVGTSYGLLILYHVDDNTTEIVGRVEGGVNCIAPSPDGDLLGVVSGFDRILVMTHDWDLIYEVELEDPPEDNDVRESTFSSNYPFRSPMSWRGDGKYFVTMSKVKGCSPFHKKLQVWERDTGTLHSVSESKVFMGELLDWMPSGAKIVAVYDRKQEQKNPSIVFFERNGLERSYFSVNGSLGATIEVLKWNCNSELLAAVVRCEKYDDLRIWFFSNNHWYLKQEFRYPIKDGVRFMWDPIKPLQLICWTVTGHITFYNFVWMTAVMDNSVAFVIDDSKILVTPLSLSLIPPPLFLFDLKFPSAVRDIAFCSKGSRNLLAATCSDGSLCIAELPALDTWEDLDGKEICVEASNPEVPFGAFVHLTWLDSSVLIGVSHFDHSHSCPAKTSSGKVGLLRNYLQEIKVVCAEDSIPGLVTCSGWNANIYSQMSLDGLVIGMVPNPVKKCSAFLQFDDGKVFEYISKLSIATGASLQKHDAMSFPLFCPWMVATPFADGDALKHLLLFGLDANNRLYVNGITLCNNCSSFSFYSNSADHNFTHLILSTKQDLLFVVNITDITGGLLELEYDNFLPVVKKRNGEEERKYINVWERGAKVVGVLHGDESAVILLTARGNLECIYPRKLIVASIVNALVQGRYKDALLMVRRHRIDFNFILDHCSWQDFIQHATEFVREVNNLSYITEFACSIKNENSMETLYNNYVAQPCMKGAKAVEGTYSRGSDGNNKVTSVLLAIRKALEEHVVESPARELCILTTLAKSDPPALEEALERIKKIREMELLGCDDPGRTSLPSAEESLKHLLWLSDPEAVYDAALGIYDLNLAAMVALNLQRDPKEFLPFLQKLECMPTFLMQYNIDIKLLRYESALKHIASAGEAYYEDCMNLMKKNPQLFPLGLQLITDSAKRRQVMEAWGDHLRDIKSFEEAAKTYICCSSFDKSLKAFRAYGNWGGVLTVAGLIKLGKEQIVQLAHELCDELQALGKPGEAAKIALEYCGDVNTAIDLLIAARDWEEALRIAYMHRREDLVSEVDNASLECAGILIGEFEEGLEKVGKYVTRYLAVRQRRLLLAAKLQADDRSINELDDDTASEASSSFSGMSAYTKGTGKGSATSVSSTTSTRAREMRHKRNRGKIRAGSPGEEMALVDHLKGMSLSDGSKRELKALMASLLMFGKEDLARRLQRIGKNFVLFQIAAVKLAEDAVNSNDVDENAYSLEHYVQKVKKEIQHSEAFSWQSEVLLSN